MSARRNQGKGVSRRVGSKLSADATYEVDVCLDLGQLVDCTIAFSGEHQGANSSETVVGTQRSEAGAYVSSKVSFLVMKALASRLVS
jgi:hypothetical protein